MDRKNQMVALSHENIRSEIIGGLRRVGYHGGLLAERYRFLDYFSSGSDEREVVAAAFSQTPISYDSACIGVVEANGLSGSALIDRHRALGAPTMLEVDGNEVREWAVSGQRGGHGLIDRYPVSDLGRLFASRASAWAPEAFLRAKNIGKFHWSPQLELFAGLVPELEGQIQEKMEPLLRDALSATKSTYESAAGREPDPPQLFQLIFWLLTAKVFHDREVGKFAHFEASSDADDMLFAVAAQHQRPLPRLLNKQARAMAASRIWRDMDFRNLSVEVLSQIWSTTLVDDETRKKLGIHRTSRTIVRYIIDRIPFKQAGDEELIVLEPCCGSGVFLVGAMNELRHTLFSMPPSERHSYFTKRLAGVEKEPFGVEISRLSLTLADFPNPDGWNIVPGDVFDSETLPPLLRRAAVVLCNPPFEDIAKADRYQYELESVLKPAELLHRVLRDLHPAGVLGFVLPRGFVDRRGYASVRRKLAERFAKIEITLLPDRAFEADHETALLIASDPIPHALCTVINRTVDDTEDAWRQFELLHAVSRETQVEQSPDQVEDNLSIPELAEVWESLTNSRSLADCAEIHRGIEWNKALTENGQETGNRQTLIRESSAPGFLRGVPPKASFSVFERPHTPYLDMRELNQRGSAFRRNWRQAKVIVNKARRSRGKWKMAAFPDNEGVTCYQTFIAVWPKNTCPDIWTLSAIINGPLANAFVATREQRDITIETLKQIPMPHLSESQSGEIKKLVLSYQNLFPSNPMTQFPTSEGNELLKQIDAAVLDGYHLPPRVEHALLEFMRDAERPTPFAFGPYLPLGEDVFFSLSDRLSPSFKKSTAGETLSRMTIA